MHLPREKRLRLVLFLGVALGSITIAVVAYSIDFFKDFESQTVDTRFTIRDNHKAPFPLSLFTRAPDRPKDVVVVQVDDRTFSDLNVRWPFPRSMHARLLDRIRQGDPKAVAFDIQFSEFTPVREDNALTLAIKRAFGKVTLSTTEVSANGTPNLIWTPTGLRAIGARAGNGVFINDHDGPIRHLRYKTDDLKALSLVTAEVVRDEVISSHQMGGASEWINFPGPPGTVTAYSYSQVMPERLFKQGHGRRPWKLTVPGAQFLLGSFKTKADAEKFQRHYQIPVSAFRNKVVVVGASAPSLQDIHDVATGNNMPGPEIQADAIETALQNFPLRSSSTAISVFLIVVLGLVPAVVGFFGGPLLSSGAGIFFAAIFAGGTQLAFNHGRVISFVYPMTAVALSTVGALGAHYTLAAFERERVRDVFSRFVPEQVVDQVLSQTGSDLRLLGKEVVGTVMFSDLRGFTSSAEEMPAGDVIQVLNHYLHEMSEAILAHNGTLLCYMGDGIYALFGAPMAQDDHADRALAAAREMLTERLPQFNNWMREQGFGEGYLMGIGLNTGSVMTGNVGHARRMDYTAVGDVTNTASRIEGMTKPTPYSVLIAESTIEALSEKPTDLVFYDELEVRGRHAKLRLWALDIRKPEAPPATEPSAEKPSEAPAAAPVKGA